MPGMASTASVPLWARPSRRAAWYRRTCDSSWRLAERKSAMSVAVDCLPEAYPVALGIRDHWPAHGPGHHNPNGRFSGQLLAIGDHVPPIADVLHLQIGRD